MASDVTVGSIMSADDTAAIIEVELEWSDVLDLDVSPAVSAGHGLRIGPPAARASFSRGDTHLLRSSATCPRTGGTGREAPALTLAREGRAKPGSRREEICWWLYGTTVTLNVSGAPGTGVQGVGAHAPRPGSNGTSTLDEPGLAAFSDAVNDAPPEWLEARASTLGSEMRAGPGQLPPVISLPPLTTTTEPT
jgi:hypothetical protein